MNGRSGNRNWGVSYSKSSRGRLGVLEGPWVQIITSCPSKGAETQSRMLLSLEAESGPLLVVGLHQEFCNRDEFPTCIVMSTSLTTLEDAALDSAGKEQTLNEKTSCF